MKSLHSLPHAQRAAIYKATKLTQLIVGIILVLLMVLLGIFAYNF